MKQIRVFTEEHRDILEQKLPTDVSYNLNGLVDGLAEAAMQIMGKGEKQVLEGEFRDFLSKNEYIHLDAFIRICLEDVYA